MISRSGGSRDAELAQTQDQAARERRLREEAEGREKQAEVQASADREALEAERAERVKDDERSAALAAPPAAPPPQPYIEPPVNRTNPETERNQRRMAARAAHLQQLRGTVGPLDILDASSGLVVIVGDADFRGAALSPSTAAILARLGPLVMATPGVTVEANGYTDVAGEQREALASQRAQAVRYALAGGGLNAGVIVARGMGSSRPRGSNASAAGREQNRRVEIVIAGDAIGSLPLWDKTYNLSLQR